jgi:hypothetical protein
MDLQIVRKWTSEDEAIFMPFMLMMPSSGGPSNSWSVLSEKSAEFYVDDSIINLS